MKDTVRSCPSLMQQQQALLVAIWHTKTSNASSTTDLIADGALFKSVRGLKAYQINSQALAERVLTAAYPVVTALVSDETMRALAQALWQAHPPTEGDLACWGGALPAFLEQSAMLQELRVQLPWLSDVAKLEWALHTVQTVADVPAADPKSLHLLTQDDALSLGVRWTAGTQVLHLAWSVDAVVSAHQQPQDTWPDALAALGGTWVTPNPQTVLIGRLGWRTHHRAIAPQEAALVNALLQGQDLFAALEQHAIDGASWLSTMWQEGWILEIQHNPQQ